MNKRSWLRQPLTYFWVITNFLFLFMDRKSLFDDWGMDGTVILVGNFLLFLVFVLSYWLTVRSFKSTNAQSFVRAIYMSFIIKFFVIAIVAFVYIMIAKEAVSKKALFACMGLYAIYAFLEVRSLTKLLKEKKNA